MKYSPDHQELDDVYKTIATPCEGLFKDRGSRFISLAWPVSSKEEAEAIVAGQRRKYHDARHVCYAWRLGTGAEEEYRVNDDGEPSGTAGKPIYGQLLSRGLTNLLVTVVRYFGGTKLGVPGLINAYRSAAEDALDNGRMVEKTVDARLTLRFPYVETDGVMKLIKDYGPKIREQEFDNLCSITLDIRRGDEEAFVLQAGKLNGVTVEHHGYNQGR